MKCCWLVKCNVAIRHIDLVLAWDNTHTPKIVLEHVCQRACQYMHVLSLHDFAVGTSASVFSTMSDHSITMERCSRSSIPAHRNGAITDVFQLRQLLERQVLGVFLVPIPIGPLVPRVIHLKQQTQSTVSQLVFLRFLLLSFLLLIFLLSHIDQLVEQSPAAVPAPRGCRHVLLFRLLLLLLLWQHRRWCQRPGCVLQHRGEQTEGVARCPHQQSFSMKTSGASFTRRDTSSTTANANVVGSSFRVGGNLLNQMLSVPPSRTNHDAVFNIIPLLS